MNYLNGNFEDDQASYTVSYRAAARPEKQAREQRGGFGRRRGTSPVQFNGIHRRRRKKIRW